MMAPRVRSAVVLASSLVLTGGIFAADRMLPPELSLSVFYVVPVALAAWFGDVTMGLSIAAVAAIVWTEADTTAHLYTHPGYAAWNAGVHLLWFGAAAGGLGRLREALDDAISMARTDVLTGVANRRCFRELAHAVVGRTSPLTLVYIDVDGFKAVNDLRGHAAGDQLLRRIAQTLRSVVREGDALARLGGDEFALLLPATDENDAAGLLDRVRLALSTVASTEGWPVTFSIGAVTAIGQVRDVDTLMNRADEEMYRAKHDGKDRTNHRVLDPA